MRGQIVSHIFIYILGIITVGFILLLGFQAITKLQENQCTVQRTQFVTQLDSAMESNKGWGISIKETFTLPCDAQEVCFVSRQSADTNQLVSDGSPEATAVIASHGVIADAITSGDDVNVFLKTQQGYERLERFETAAPVDLPANCPIRCFSGNPIEIRFAGKGQLVEPKLLSGGC